MLPTTPLDNVTRASSNARLLPAQLGLLYANTNLGAAVTVVAATVLGALQWTEIPRFVVVGWWSYMAIVSVARHALARRYWRGAATTLSPATWLNRFTFGAGAAGAGWGAAGIFLYPPESLTHQVFLIFVLGGMMLGASSLLAPRKEAFLAFLLPAGFIPALRLSLQGDRAHLAMALLATLFTIATLVTTKRTCRMVHSSLSLQMENHDLVEELQSANTETAALNQALELRVAERTAALHASTEQLRAEIAQREQAEEELLRARKLESIGVLAGGIAHDFNNFLTVVQGNIEIAKVQLKTGEPIQDFLDQAGNACQRAKILSSQLLTFAKGGAPVRRLTSVARIVTEAVHLARTGSPIGIDVSIAENLYNAEVDHSQIGQVLHNILLNARQATPDGGKIEVTARNIELPSRLNGAADLGVRISVRDTGCGIPAEVLRRIFDPYFTTKPGGSGLGLATAYAIVVKHGGHITAESSPDAGTLFTIDLPASQEAPLPEIPKLMPMRTGTERLLVMDDDEALQILFKAVLTRLGYVVETARDGEEAIAKYRAAKTAEAGFDVVVLDLTVPGGMGGMEAAAKLRAFDPDARLVVSSGYSEAPVMSHFADYGFDAVISKPWTVREMSEVLRRVLVQDHVQSA